jgi:predicted ATPase
MVLIIIVSLIFVAFIFIRRKRMASKINGKPSPEPDTVKSTSTMIPNISTFPFQHSQVYNMYPPTYQSNVIEPVTSINGITTPSLSPVTSTEIQVPTISMSALPNFQTRMIGREHVMSELNGYLARGLTGQGCTVLVSGEAGIGKTRVIKELITEAQFQNFRVLLGNCMYESQTPFMPFLESLKTAGMDQLLLVEVPRVEAVYLVTPSGLLIKEIMRHETSLDADMFSSVLTTVSNFVTESLSTLLRDDEDGTLNTLGYENYRIIIRSRKNVNVVAIISGRENESLLNDMRDMAKKINDDFGSSLEHWDGTQDSVIGIEQIIQPLITSGKYDGPKESNSDLKGRRVRLFENVSNGLLLQSNQKPILLILEDLHWADPSSLGLMHYLSQILKGKRTIILGTFRTEEIIPSKGEPHPLNKIIESMTSEGLVEKLELQRLTKENTNEFFSVIMGETDFSEVFINLFYKETGGNPLFMVELIKFFIEEKVIINENGTWHEAKDIQNIEIPSKIYNVILRRLEHLDHESRKVLDFASVLGDTISPLVLSKAMDVNEISILNKLKVLEHTHRLIQSIDNEFKFDHDMIKEVLYNEIPEELRVEYHSILAKSIEMLNENNLNEVLGELAFHYYKCRNKEKALHYVLRAAENAKKIYSLEESVRFYTQALELEDDEENRKEIYQALISVSNSGGNST